MLKKSLDRSRTPVRTSITVLIMIGLSFGAIAASPQITEVKRDVLALSYPEGATISIRFRGTERLPRANGEAKVERKRGSTEIEVELDEMKPAESFGGDFNTYVLWVVSPEGQVDNIGEFILRGNRSKLNVTTGLDTFGMLITAEPHFLVDRPSQFVVLENVKPHTESLVRDRRLRYIGYDSRYQYDRESLVNMREADVEVRPHLSSARTAVDLAVRAGADKFAVEELKAAKDSLRKAESAMDVGAGKRSMMLAGNKVIRLAVKAERLARERSFQAALDAEREARANEISSLEDRMGQAQTEAEKARLLAEKRKMQADMEARARREAQDEAAESARLAREAEDRARRSASARRRAEEEAADAERARRQADQARLEAERAADAQRRQRNQALDRMRTAMERVTQVRRTAEGLIINLPDILFDFNKAALKPQAREILAKLSGMLEVMPEFALTVAGHTDSVGSEEYNLKLSEKRAESVREYLIVQGVSADLITTRGYGESRPIAENNTNAGRQKNRRVEILIAEELASSDEKQGNQ